MDAAEKWARLFHDTYERLAPDFGYSTRTDTRQFDPTTPNGRLMIAVCGEVVSAVEQAVRAAAFQDDCGLLCHYCARGDVPTLDAHMGNMYWHDDQFSMNGGPFGPGKISCGASMLRRAQAEAQTAGEEAK